MNRKTNPNNLKHELDSDDRLLITEVFLNDVVDGLKRRHARTGVLNCDFAGEKYENWNLIFKSSGSDFVIVGFEYDEDSRSFNLFSPIQLKNV